MKNTIEAATGNRLRNQPMKTIIIAAMSAILGTAAVEAHSPTQKRERAAAVLKSLETGDAKAWEQHVSAEKYIQHNLAFPNGREGEYAPRARGWRRC